MQLISPRQTSLNTDTGVADQTCGITKLSLVPGQDGTPVKIGWGSEANVVLMDRATLTQNTHT